MVRKTTVKAEDEKAGMTAGEIRAALEGVPDGVRPRVRVGSAFNSDGGFVRRVTVETE